MGLKQDLDEATDLLSDMQVLFDKKDAVTTQPDGAKVLELTVTPEIRQQWIDRWNMKRTRLRTVVQGIPAL